MQNVYLLVNFGGPRNLEEISPFLISLLTDRETIRTCFPSFLQDLFFTQIAKKRAKKIRAEYQSIGGASPIFRDTESIKNALEKTLSAKVITYHRFLPATHQSCFEALKKVEEEQIIVFPLYPQFSYATTGSAAKQLLRNLSLNVLKKMSWIKSYPSHPDFIALFQNRIRSFLVQKDLEEEETILLFSAHGLPKKFIDEGDPYKLECELSFFSLRNNFPKAQCLLAFQSKFGRGEWIKPYTQEICETIKTWGKEKKNVVFIPLSFTSDHIETLVEIEHLYLPIVQKLGFNGYRLPAFNQEQDWIETITKILQNFTPTTTRMLVRKP